MNVLENNLFDASIFPNVADAIKFVHTNKTTSASNIFGLPPPAFALNSSLLTSPHATEIRDIGLGTRSLSLDMHPSAAQINNEILSRLQKETLLAIGKLSSQLMIKREELYHHLTKLENLVQSIQRSYQKVVMETIQDTEDVLRRLKNDQVERVNAIRVGMTDVEKDLEEIDAVQSSLALCQRKLPHDLSYSAAYSLSSATLAASTSLKQSGLSDSATLQNIQPHIISLARRCDNLVSKPVSTDLLDISDEFQRETVSRLTVTKAYQSLLNDMEKKDQAFDILKEVRDLFPNFL